MSKEEDMQRTLCAEFGPLAIQFNPLSGDFDILAPGGGYTSLGSGAFVLQQDIDLSGYAMDKKTFYPYSSFEQRSGTTVGTFAAVLTTQPYILESTIVSSVPLNNADLGVALVYAPGFNQFSGLAGGRFNRSQIIHGEYKLYTVDSTMAVAGGSNTVKLLDRQVYSSLEPTASDKLYCYRILTIASTTGEAFQGQWPSTRVLIPGTISSEPKLEYMMRLKRSYELANQV